MSIEDLPHFIEHEIEYENGEVLTWKFFLSINRDSEGKWSCGYVHYASDELTPDGEPDTEMAIPQLFFNSADNLDEIAIRMKAKIERYRKLQNHGRSA